MPNEYGDDELAEFECGSTRGYREGLCADDPRFPNFEDYDLEFSEDAGSWYCWARGRTTWAKAVDLQHGHGASKAKARVWVEHSYILAKFGHAEAERRFPFSDLM